MRLIPHTNIANPVKDINALNTVCLTAFNQRRKTIRNSFKKLINVEQLASLNIDANLRPENLSLDEYIKLANFIVDNPAALTTETSTKRISKARAAQANSRSSKEKPSSDVD